MSLSAWAQALANRHLDPPRMMHIGDSTTFGAGSSNAETKRWPVTTRSLLADRAPVTASGTPSGGWSVQDGYWHVDNGQPGWTTADHLADAAGNGPVWVTAFPPHLVTVQVGANEMYGATPVATFKTNLTTLIGRVRDRCQASIVLVVNYDETSNGGWSAYASGILEVAQQQAADVVDLRTVMPANEYRADGSQVFYNADDYHPTDAGYNVMAHTIVDHLSPQSLGGWRWAETADNTEAALVLDGIVTAGNVTTVAP